jgi:ketosteroid isomerase-like protein
MSREENISLLNRYFAAMAAGDWQTVEDMYHENIVIHMAGSTPASGRLVGKGAVTQGLIAKRWKIMCADDERVVAIMEGGGPTLSGDNYEQTYCEIFKFEDAKVIEMYAFFDTALAERALFGNPLTKEHDAPPQRLAY